MFINTLLSNNNIYKTNIGMLIANCVAVSCAARGMLFLSSPFVNICKNEIYPAHMKVDIKVNMSPILNSPVPVLVIILTPINPITTANLEYIFIFSRDTNQYINGVSAVVKLVINAALPIVVYFNPNVCNKKPTTQNNPNKLPCLIVLLSTFIICFPKNIKHNNNAIQKRIKRYNVGEQYCNPICVNKNVPPHIEVPNSNNDFAFQDFIYHKISKNMIKNRDELMLYLW